MSRHTTRPFTEADRDEREQLLSGRVSFRLADLPQCVGISCEQGDQPCTEGCPNVRQGAAPTTAVTAEETAALHQAAGMALVDTTSEPHPLDSEPCAYYTQAWREGAIHGGFFGLLAGMLLVAGCIRLGQLLGGAL